MEYRRGGVWSTGGMSSHRRNALTPNRRHAAFGRLFLMVQTDHA
jgi:hypothetical protein